MNSLNEAIMTLGRSFTQIRNGGWKRGSLIRDGGRCATGLLTHHLGGLSRPSFYMSDKFQFHMLGLEEQMTLRQAGQALVKAATDAQWRAALSAYDPDAEAFALILAAKGGSDRMMDIESAVIGLNDHGMATSEAAQRWFSDAIDVLAAELPVPARPLFRAEAEQALTFV